VNRRQFLRGIALAAPLVLVPSVVARTYFLPPRMGWPARNYFLVNTQAAYYFSGPKSYLENLAQSSIPGFWGKWRVMRDLDLAQIRPFAGMRHTGGEYGTYPWKPIAIELDSRGVAVVEGGVEREEVYRDEHVVLLKGEWERAITARAVGADGTFSL
jgi:hypothetical protein